MAMKIRHTSMRPVLAPQVQIWKAQSVGAILPARNLTHVDKYVLNQQRGRHRAAFKLVTAAWRSAECPAGGGLNPDNCVEAAKTGCAGLDFNSGVESQPGIKDASKLASVLKLCVHIKEEKMTTLLNPYLVSLVGCTSHKS